MPVWKRVGRENPILQCMMPAYSNTSTSMHISTTEQELRDLVRMHITTNDAPTTSTSSGVVDKWYWFSEVALIGRRRNSYAYIQSCTRINHKPFPFTTCTAHKRRFKHLQICSIQKIPSSMQYAYWTLYSSGFKLKNHTHLLTRSHPLHSLSPAPTLTHTFPTLVMLTYVTCTCAYLW